MNGVELCSKSLGDPADPPILLSDDGLCKIPVVCALGEPDQRGASRSRRGATISRVRLWFALGTSLSAFLLTGCGRGERASWEGPTVPLPTSGSLPVAGFARYVDAISEPWERSPVGLATAYALPLVRASGDVHATFPANDPEGSDVVVVTLKHLLDDSVRGLRLELRLEPRDDGSWRLLEATWAQRCHAGRGHQGWSPEACV